MGVHPSGLAGIVPLCDNDAPKSSVKVGSPIVSAVRQFSSGYGARTMSGLMAIYQHDPGKTAL